MRAITKIVLVLVLLALPAANALADADPASDVLLGSPAFFPYQPAVAPGLQNQLVHELGSLKKKGLALKVAIIESPIDLGAIPNMFGRPQTYADFLGREISFNQPQPLLVVMPAGFGTSHVGNAGVLAGLPVDKTQRSNGLARSAILAVQRIAEAAGKPVAAGKASGGGSGASPLITFAAPAILVLIGAFVAARLHRRATDRAE